MQSIVSYRRLSDMRSWFSQGAAGFALFAAVILLSFHSPTAAATLPTNFTESLVANGLTSPTAMAFAPDGRLFVCQQGGQLRVIKNSALLATPFVTLTVNSSGERGLLGIAFDPNLVPFQCDVVSCSPTVDA